MSDDSRPVAPKDVDDFVRQAARGSGGFFGDFLDFLRHHRKWWLTPILAVLLLAGAVAILGGTALAPFIYTLF